MGAVVGVVRFLPGPDVDPVTGGLRPLEGELVDRFVLAGMGAGFLDGSVADDRATLTQFAIFLRRGLWAVQPTDVDAWLASLRRQGLSRATVYGRANTLARFYTLVVRQDATIATFMSLNPVQPPAIPQDILGAQVKKLA
ncbi:integrase [Streptomyces sp. NPDC057280]|uniref:integrase n=1 Tax=Streptomyces sp. NPDC057280 TaxID=3346081 RepID=UPI003640A6C3